MNADLIFSNICRHIPLSDEEKAYLLDVLVEEHLGRNKFILRQGELCEQIHFVNSGILRAYCINADGREATVMYAVKDWWITDMYCFLNGFPAMVNI